MPFILLILFTLILAIGSLFYGSVSIPPTDVLNAITGSSEADNITKVIIWESRLPMTLTALFAGASLSVAGLILQTVFQNPLAGPSILGVSSGASLGVAIVLLSAGTFLSDSTILEMFSSIGGAFLGSCIVILLLLLFSTILRGISQLLIAGIMIGYILSSAISLLNFFAPAEGVKSFVIWGLGSYSGIGLQGLPWFIGISGLFLLASFLFIKPLNAFLLGERYAANMGYSIKRQRTLLLGLSGVLTGIVTAFCGPIGFIGLAVPHIARMLFKTSNHVTLIPATILCGASLSLLCCILTIVPGIAGVIPINAITPCVGVPVILYILINKHKIKYFN